MRVRWKLAALFGGMSMLSAGSIVWAFLSPEASTEISSMDYFNLLWAGVSMLLTFVAFLVCFEFPRGEEVFGAAEPAFVSARGAISKCVIEAISPSCAVLRQDGLLLDVGEPALLDLPGAGWTEIRASGWDGDRTVVDLVTSPTQHRALIAWLFSAPRDAIARQASMSGAFSGLVRRSLRLA